MIFLIGLCLLAISFTCLIALLLTFDTVGECFVPAIYVFGYTGAAVIAYGVGREAVRVFL